MNDSLAGVMRQRGKVVALLVLLGFVQCMVHPETTASVWGPMSLAVGALASMEALAAKKTTQPGEQ